MSDDNDERVLGFFWFGFGTEALYWVFFFFFIFIFFLFFYKHSIGVCFAFALYRLYWGLVFSASDVTVGTVGLIFDSLCWFFLLFFYFLFII